MRAKPILIYGASQFGAVLKALVADLGLTFAGFIDDWGSGGEILGAFDHLARNFAPEHYAVTIGVGYKHMRARRELAGRVQSLGFDLPALIHPRAYVAPTARVGAGVVVMAGAIVDTDAHVGELSVLWPGAIVNHHSLLEGNTFLSPASIVCGSTSVGIDCFVGAGATIVDGIAVPASTFVKAGSVYSGSGAARKRDTVRPLRAGGA